MKVEIELDDTTGKPTGSLPDAVQKFVDSKFSEGFGKGSEKAAKEAQAQIEAAIREAKTGNDPLAREKVATLEKEAARLKEEIAKRDGDWAGQLEARKQQEALELQARDEQIAALTAANAKRTARLKALAAAEIKAAALKFGALDSAVDDLAAILVPQIGLDDDLQWFVIDPADGKSARLDGDKKPVTVEGLVQQTLTEKPYFQAAGQKTPVSSGARSIHGRRSDSPTATALEAAEAAPTAANLAAAGEAILARSRAH